MGTEIDRLEIDIEAAASRANAQLNKLVDNLTKVANSTLKIKTNHIAETGTASAKSSGGVEQLSKALNQLVGNTTKATKSFKGFSRAASNFYTNCFLAVRGIKKLGKTVDSAMDYTETFNYWNVALGKIGKDFAVQNGEFGKESAEAYTKSFSDRLSELTRKMTGYEIGENGELLLTDGKNLGINPEQLMDYQAQVASVTNAVGLCGETSINAAKALSMLAVDASSFFNKDLAQVMRNFQSGLVGQSRVMQQYGIDITNANLQQYAYNLGLSRSVSEMTQAEKMQLRLLVILDKSRVALGDQANTLSSAANQYRIMQQQLANLGRTIGNILLPILKVVLPFVNGLIMAVTKLMTILGFKIHGEDWLEKLQDGSSKGFADGGLEDLGDSADDAAGSLEDANAAAKKLKTTTLGIDELNINAPDAGAGGLSSSMGGGIDLSGAIAGALAEYESIWEKAFADAEAEAQEWADKICGFFQRIAEATRPFQEAIKRLWDEGLSKFANFTWTALKDFYNEFLIPIGKWAFGEAGSGLTRLVDVINNSLLAVEWEKLNTSLRNFWIAIEPYAEQFGEGLIDFFEDVARLSVDTINAFPGLLDRFSAALENGNLEKARSWGYALGELAVAFLALKGVATVVSGIAKLGAAFKDLAYGLSGVFGSDGMFVKMGALIGKLFGKVKSLFGKVGALFAKIGESFALMNAGAGSFGEVITAMFPKAAVAGITAGLTALVAGLAYVFATNEDVRQSFSEALASIGVGLGEIANAILPSLTEAWNGLMKILRPLGEFLVGAFTSIWQDMINPALSFIGNEVLPKLASAFSNLWNNVLSPFGAFIVNILAPAMQVISDVLTMLWQNIVVPLAEFIGNVFSVAFEELSNMFTSLTERVQPFMEALQFMMEEVFAPIVDYLWQNFKPAFETVFKAIGGIIEGLSTALGGLIKFVSGVFTADWQKAWEGVKEIFRGIFNSLISVAEGVINLIIEGINHFLSKFDGIVTSIGEIIGIDIKIPQISPISIPRFAQGGYPETGQLFMARENGINEMVGRIGNRSAVANNDQIVESISRGVYNAIVGAVSATMTQNYEQPIIVKTTVNMDMRTFIEQEDEFRARMGYRLSY